MAHPAVHVLKQANGPRSQEEGRSAKAWGIDYHQNAGLLELLSLVRTTIFSNFFHSA